MTPEEIDEMLGDAVGIEFRPRTRSVALIFNNEYEADNCYGALKTIFEENPLTLRLYKKADKIDLFITHEDQFVRVYNLETSVMEQDSLDFFIKNEAKSEKIKLVFVFKTHFRTLTVVNFKNSDKREGLNISNWEVL